jgi:Flp pilus assembly protein TadD
LVQALEVEPENTKIVSNLGIVAMKQGTLEEAAGFFRTVMELDPDDPLAPRYLEAIEKKINPDP